MKSTTVISGCAAAIILLCGNSVYAGESTATSGSNSLAAATGINRGVNQGITFNNQSPDSKTIYATVPSYAPPSAFGFSPQNCGASDTTSVGTPWVSFGGSDAHGLVGCNARADTKIIWKMGMHKVAKVRFFCFGLPANKKAYVSVGGVCPEPTDENTNRSYDALSSYSSRD